MEKIKDYQNYFIDKKGKLYSNMFHHRRNPQEELRELKVRTDGQGYLQVWLYTHRKKRKFRVHRLVAKTFIPNPENKPFVNHINGIKSDNRAVNLEWCTRAENNEHAFANGLQNPRKPLQQMTVDGELVAEFASQKEASRYTGVPNNYISEAFNGKRKTAGGFIWVGVLK